MIQKYIFSMQILYTIIFFFLFFLPHFCFSKELTPAEVYFNKRALSDKNINFSLGFPIFIPSLLFKDTLSQNFFIQMDYRKEKMKKHIPPLFTRIRFNSNYSKNIQSISLFSGIRFPQTHRKTPFYLNMAFGGEIFPWDFKKVNFHFQVSGIFRLIQITRRISAITEININYKLNQYRWWTMPSFIALFIGIDINI